MKGAFVWGAVVVLNAFVAGVMAVAGEYVHMAFSLAASVLSLIPCVTAAVDAADEEAGR